MKAGLWKTDWFLGAVVVLVVLAFNRASDLIPSLEQKAYDLGVQSTSRQPSDKVAVIAIDDTSIANIGRWPWSRENQGHRKHRVLQRAADRSGIRLHHQAARPRHGADAGDGADRHAAQGGGADAQYPSPAGGALCQGGQRAAAGFLPHRPSARPARQAAAGILPEERRSRENRR